MSAIDTLLFSALNPGAGPTACVNTQSGDPFAVRYFAPPAEANMIGITRMGTTAGFAQVRSPVFHDVVQGIRITPAESPAIFALPAGLMQNLEPNDNLIVEMSGGAAETDIVGLIHYYDNLPGIQARLYNWSDILPNIANVKPIRIAVTSSATVGAWVDTVITTTEDLTKANTDYAILGYSANTALGLIGVKGSDTGNLRVGGPGSTSEFPTTQYFKWLSDQTGKPCIPVFNAANKNNTFVSVAAATASVASVVELIIAQLSPNLS